MNLRKFALASFTLAAMLIAAPGAFAFTECPGQESNIPGPYFVYFQTGSAQIDQKGMAAIAEAAAKAKALYLTRVCVRGKADKTGNATMNQELSQKRADAVAAQLAKAGVEQKYIMVVAKGEPFGSSMSALSGDNQADRTVKIILAK